MRCSRLKFLDFVDFAEIFIVTDHEISRGILKATDVDNRTLVFIRNIEDIEEFVKDGQDILGKFIDLDENKNVDEASKKHLNNLKLDKIPNAYKSASENITTYTVSYKLANISFYSN